MRSRQGTWGQELDGIAARVEIDRSYVAAGNLKRQKDVDWGTERIAFLERRMRELGKRRSSAFYPSSADA